MLENIVLTCLLMGVLVLSFCLYRSRKQYGELKETSIRKEADLESQVKRYEDKLQDIQQDKDSLLLRFKDLSADILKTQTDILEEKQQKSLQNILNPFKQDIDDFKQKVKDAHKDSIAGKSSLETQLRELMRLNQNLSKDADNLAQALKGKKKLQGDWGEFQLTRILELSGLEEGLNYEIQVNLKDSANHNLRPDCIINLPADRKVIVDSKVSLNDYVLYINEVDETLRNKHIDNYVKCLKKHIDELAGKDYQSLIKGNSLDYVMMFVPVESAYIEAIRYDDSIFDYAYKKKVAIATPSSLLPLLKLVEGMWRVDKQSKSSERMAETGALLYDKICNFASDMEQIDKSLTSATVSYQNALKKLSTGNGNALSLTERLKKLGAKTSKNIPLEFEDTDN